MRVRMRTDCWPRTVMSIRLMMVLLMMILRMILLMILLLLLCMSIPVTSYLRRISTPRPSSRRWMLVLLLLPIIHWLLCCCSSSIVMLLLLMVIGGSVRIPMLWRLSCCCRCSSYYPIRCCRSTCYHLYHTMMLWHHRLQSSSSLKVWIIFFFPAISPRRFTDTTGSCSSRGQVGRATCIIRIVVVVVVTIKTS